MAALGAAPAARKLAVRCNATQQQVQPPSAAQPGRRTLLALVPLLGAATLAKEASGELPLQRCFPLLPGNSIEQDCGGCAGCNTVFQRWRALNGAPPAARPSRSAVGRRVVGDRVVPPGRVWCRVPAAVAAVGGPGPGPARPCLLFRCLFPGGGLRCKRALGFSANAHPMKFSAMAAGAGRTQAAFSRMSHPSTTPARPAGQVGCCAGRSCSAAWPWPVRTILRRVSQWKEHE